MKYFWNFIAIKRMNVEFKDGKMQRKNAFEKIERPLTVLKKLGVYCIAMHENCKVIFPKNYKH